MNKVRDRMSRKQKTLTPELAAKLEEIFEFLLRNRRFNELVQHAAYRQDVLPWPDTGSKLRFMLHSKQATQSQPDLDKQFSTWKRLEQHYADFECVRTADDLAKALWAIAADGKTKPAGETKTFDDMWTALDAADCFGAKTAALFVKSIIDIHTLEINRDLRFLDDFQLDPSDVVRLPVDSVIIHIFKEIGGASNFTKINDQIWLSGLSSTQWPTLWDDLWFWGFITQRKKNAQRVTALNEAKFISILGAPWDLWPEVESSAIEFINITNPRIE